MRVLITGSSGFVGGYLVRELMEAGHEVVACDLREPKRGSIEDPPWYLPREVEFRRCDLTLANSVSDLLSDVRPDAVVHLAAQSSAAVSIENPRETLKTNLFGTLNLLEAARTVLPKGCDATRSRRVRILSIGSAEEYGKRNPSEMPLGESSPVEPISPYAVSKASQTMLAMQYARVYGMDIIATRSFAHTGAGQSDRFALPSFARQCAEISVGRREKRVRVGRLDIVRDYSDVRDTVRAYRLILEAGKAGSVYNVCSGEGLSLESALNFFVRASGTDIEIEVDPALLRPVDIPVLIGNNWKLRNDCRFERRISMEKMLGDLFAHWLLVSRGVRDV